MWMADLERNKKRKAKDGEKDSFDFKIDLKYKKKTSWQKDKKKSCTDGLKIGRTDYVQEWTVACAKSIVASRR